MVTLPHAAVFTVRVRADLNTDAARAEAYRLIGLTDDARATPHPDTAAAVAFIAGALDLAAHPGTDTRAPYGDRGDSEGRATHLHLLSYGPDSYPRHSWLLHAETVHAAWPRLLDVLGVTLSGGVFDNAVAQFRPVHVPAMRVPKPLRLKGGWDYDADYNQVWLPFDEVWARLLDYDQARPVGRRWSRRRKCRVRRHMRALYRRRRTATPDPTERSTP